MLETDRLYLKPITLADQEAVYSSLNYPKTVQAMSIFDWPLDDSQILTWCQRAEAGYFCQREYILLAIDKNEALAIGGVGLHLNDDEPRAAETGYWVDQARHGRGYASEMIRGILQFGFVTLGLNTIYATTAHDNDGSIRVLDKAGFAFAGHTEVVCADGRVRSSKKFVITPSYE